MWESDGAIADDLASQVLVLNIRAEGDTVVCDWLRDAAGFGVPFRLTLHPLANDLVVPAARTVFVCENPAVLRTAAGELQDTGAALVCTEGVPSAVACHGAHPWRMTAADYMAAFGEGGSTPLAGPPVASPWDPGYGGQSRPTGGLPWRARTTGGNRPHERAP